MAYNDMSAFMPSKGAYTNPGEYESTQRNVALSRGTYMAEMDKVYAQLEEYGRQFDLTHGLETQRFGLEEEKFDFTKELESGKFLEGIREFDINTLLKHRELDIAAQGTQSQADYYSELTKNQKAGRLFDYIGAGYEIFREGGMLDTFF